MFSASVYVKYYKTNSTSQDYFFVKGRESSDKRMKVVCVENPQKKYLKNAMQDKRNLMNLLLVNGISQSTEAGPLFN